ncbi:MAG: anti-sigma factor [Anaerolineae bacterium]|nr:anti-sigma factor [Anaerolineae bacterium]MCI0608798.1 anti-sigma factor [Anaerolineae bacterium]
MNEKIEELLPFYALDTVTESERREVEAYVASDPEAKRRLDVLMRTASALPYASEPLEPPAALKRTLMDRVNADAQKRFVPPPPAQKSGWSRFMDFFLSSPAQWLPQGVAVLSLLIALVVGAWGFSLRNELTRLQAETALLQKELADQRLVLAQIASPNAQTFVISGTDHQPQAHGQLIADSQTGSAVLVVSGLQQLEAGKIYEFWLIQGDTPVAAGLFEVNEEGKAILQVSQAVTPESYDAIGVSIEPEAGSVQPTGDIVMLGGLD